MVETFSYNFWLGWGLLIFNIVLFVAFTRSAIIGRRALRWPTLVGVVKDKQIQELSSGDTPGVTYSPFITYTYEINGTSYTSNEYHPARARTGYNTKAKAQKLLDSVGDQIILHYNPLKPTDSYLFPYPLWVTVCALPISLFGILWALTIIFP